MRSDVRIGDQYEFLGAFLPGPFNDAPGAFFTATPSASPSHM